MRFNFCSSCLPNTDKNFHCGLELLTNYKQSKIFQIDVRLLRNTSYKVHKQEETKAATTLVSKGHLAHHCTVCLTIKQFFFCTVRCNLESIGIYSKLICRHWCRETWEDALQCAECPLFMHLAYQCCCCYSSFLFVCFVALYAGHPYIHWTSFEIFLFCLFVYFLFCTTTHFTRAPPIPAR